MVFSSSSSGGGSGAGVDGIYTDTASAGSTAIGGAATVRANITGTTTITAFTGGSAGTYKEGKFAGVLTLTHNATSLILPGGANITTAAGDTFGAVTNDGTNWRVIWYERADGSLVNKRITQRVATLTDAATVTPDCDSFDGGILTTLSQTTTIANPTGTPTDGQRYTLRIKSSTARSLLYDSQFRGGTDLALPVSTSGASKTDYLVFTWNAADSKWDIVGKTFGY